MRKITLAAMCILSACSDSDLPRTDSKQFVINPAAATTTSGVPAKSTESLEKELHLLGHSFPLSVSTVIRDKGNPNRSFIDNSEGCPVGQVHSWDDKERNYTFQVLGDSYGEPLDYKAGSRVIGLVKIDSSKPSNINGLLDINLGDEESVVKRRLDAFVMSNKTFLLTKMEEKSPLFQFLGADRNFKYLYLLEKEDENAFFIINSSGRVEAIIFSTFNVFLAC